MAQLIFAVPRVPKSVNEVEGHWSWRMKEKKQWEGQFLIIKCASPEFDFEPKVKRRVRITVYWPKRAKRCRLPDDDNIIAGFKPGRDAMKKLGFVREDNPEWSEWVWSIRRADTGFPSWPGEWDEGKNGWTEFIVEDIT